MARTQIDEINRNIYDIKNQDDYEFKMQKGLNREIVEEISKRKKVEKLYLISIFIISRIRFKSLTFSK